MRERSIDLLDLSAIVEQSNGTISKWRLRQAIKAGELIATRIPPDSPTGKLCVARGELLRWLATLTNATRIAMPSTRAIAAAKRASHPEAFIDPPEDDATPAPC